MPKATCKGKHSHNSRGAAEAHLRGILRILPEYDGRVYPCMECKGYHVGRLKKAAHRSKYDKGRQTWTSNNR